MTIFLPDISVPEKQYYLQHVIGPRPICFASTIDKQGNVNLSPFSFFNLFSIHPPIVIFSASRRVRDNTTKHTLQNVLEVPEAVINVVTYDMVQQTSLASCEYPKGVDEFVKAGFTKTPATMVSPPMVKESKVNLECKVVEVKSLGDHGGAGQLVICEVLCLHIHDDLLLPDKKFDQRRLELAARLGGDWYARISADNLFAVAKPNVKTGIGVDALPLSFQRSEILTGNDLGKLANVHFIPDIDPGFDDNALQEILQNKNITEITTLLHRRIKLLLDEGKLEQAWQTLLRVNDTTK